MAPQDVSLCGAVQEEILECWWQVATVSRARVTPGGDTFVDLVQDVDLRSHRDSARSRAVHWALTISWAEG